MATPHRAHLASTAPRLERVGSAVIRHGLALSLVWIGALKFASNEAAIEGLVANSPVLSWTYRNPGVATGPQVPVGGRAVPGRGPDPPGRGRLDGRGFARRGVREEAGTVRMHRAHGETG